LKNIVEKMSHISLYIPYIFKNIRRHHIVNTFNLLDLGNVERIDLISSSNTQQQAFVHMSYINDKKYPQLRTCINKGESFKIVYDDPWFWRVCKSRSPRGPRPPPKYPRIIFETKSLPPLKPFHPTNKFPDEGCGIIDPIFKKGAEELKNWGPAEFAIGRH